MKRLICLVLLFSCVFQLNAQKKKKEKEPNYLLDAREPGDSNFVVFANGERKEIKSAKDFDILDEVRFEFADGSTKTYKESEISCYQVPRFFAKNIPLKNGGGMQDDQEICVRYARGAINLYNASVVKVGGGGGRGVARYYSTLIEYLPGKFLAITEDTLSFGVIRKFFKHSETTIAALNELGVNYKKIKPWKNPGDFTSEYLKYILFYNKEVAEGRL